ncbi:hypothetical protein HPP92_003975 [Vanilla planifolia]|uniref:Protein kinase domain-containing protein n=1 Tax=Vanilla planifolia TaxID=51239 RepID=A0A835VG04_VANPL|nr:hypothetical protein HPP92_003975 [Vanilla planifolia]
MGRIEADLARCVLRCILVLFMLNGSIGHVSNPPSGMSPRPNDVAPIIHTSALSFSSSPPVSMKDPSLEVSPSQGSQAANVFNISAPAPRIIPLFPPDAQPKVPQMAPSTARPPGGKDFIGGHVVPPMVAPSSGTSDNLSPTIHSHFIGSSPRISPMPQEPGISPVPSSLHHHPPEGSKTNTHHIAPAFLAPGHKDGSNGGNPTSHPPASLLAPVPFERNKRGHLPPIPAIQAPVVFPVPHRLPAPPPVVSSAPSHHILPFPRNKYGHGPAISAAPAYPPAEKSRNSISPTNPEAPEVNPAPHHPCTPIPKKKRRAYPPYVEGPMVNAAPLHPPMEVPKRRRSHHTPSSFHQGPCFPPTPASLPSPKTERSITPASPPTTSERHKRWPMHYPAPSPAYYQTISQLPQPIRALPPPPPNLNCGSMTCQEPFANPPPGSPCMCVLPIRVGLRLGVALYTFFPLVSEFALEIASGVFMKQSQVRIMGANTATEDPEKTITLIDLVPLGKHFDNTTVFLTYDKFWHKQVAIQSSYFGEYDVLYVLYPGLPPAPPTASAYINVNGGAYGNGNNAGAIKPLGVDVRQKKRKLGGSLVAIVVLSSVIALVLLLGAVWLLLLKRRDHSDLLGQTCRHFQAPSAKRAAGGAMPLSAESRPSSTTASFNSSIVACTGSAKTFTLQEIEKATNKFEDSRVIGEGGFGRVYHGALEDGTRVAVKVLKRDDQQGGREFLAEIEMLSRLHHRNLVKLIGICTEESIRCLVYELVPNGSVESHLHGVDKEMSPLDWNARMKIALGAARGLAYLHEDSNPRVIHRDFKSSNILLEHDFTPKVSDFGLARTALDEGKEHISTRVMGTFGYVAPEYAMTGHLLVKSDVYSYGVVLLELLTGRKPVDMTRAPGQENLVSWVRPLLGNVEGLEAIVDPALGTIRPRDGVAKVAAIAAMCVQPEVSHRPFMGEVVQALKLVCNEGDECRNSETCSNDESASSTKCVDTGVTTERGVSQSDVFYGSAAFVGDSSDLLRMQSSSGPLGTGRSGHFWQRIRGLASRSVTEHRNAHRFWKR